MAGNGKVEADPTMFVPRSWLLVEALPHPHLDPADTDWEWFVPGGRGYNRVSFKPGDHLPLDSPVPKLWPGHFAPSTELPDVHPGVRALERGAQDRRQAMGQYRVTIPCHLKVACCGRCLQHGGIETGVPVPIVEPDALWLTPYRLNPYTDDHSLTERARSAWAAECRRLWREAEALMAERHGPWFAQHVCPEDAPALDLDSGPFIYERKLVARAERAPSRA